MGRNMWLSLVSGLLLFAVAAPAFAGEATHEEKLLLKVQDQSCTACTSSVLTLMRVSRAVREIDGVEATRINMAKQQVLVVYDADVTTSTELGIRLTELGYRATRYEQSLGTSVARK